MPLSSRSTISEIAEAAWKEAPNGVSEDFHGHRVVKLPKVVLIMPRLQDWPKVFERHYPQLTTTGNGWEIVAFSKPEDAGLFAAGKNALQPCGPSAGKRGSVGSIAMIPFYPTNSHPAIAITVVQSHYKTEEEYGIPRSLATKYAGWRKHALVELLKIAKQHDVTIGLSTSVFYPKRPIRRKPRKISSAHREFLEACRETNMQVKNEAFDHFPNLYASRKKIGT